MTVINQSDVYAEVEQVFERYEKALSNNDVDTLAALFWNNQETIRFGMNENLYGYKNIIDFCKTRKNGLSKNVRYLQIMTLGKDTAVTNIEYGRQGTDKIGRQSQTWHKFPEGWRIVSAHVSWMG